MLRNHAEEETTEGFEVRHTLYVGTIRMGESRNRKLGADAKCDVSLWKWCFVVCSVE